MYLKLQLLGNLHIEVDAAPISLSRAGKIEALLIYLAFDPTQVYSRAQLDGLLFPNLPDEAARTNLRQTLARLRRVIKDKKADPPFLLIQGEQIQFNPDSHHEIDLLSFRQAVQGCREHAGNVDLLCSSCMAQLHTAVSLYRGPFLDGFFVSDGEPFYLWTNTQHIKLEEQAINALRLLTTHHEQRGNYDLALTYGRQLLQVAPWYETAYRHLMRLLGRQGKRSQALALYQRCQTMLADEFGVAPSPATTDLAERIRQVPTPRPHRLPPADERPFLGRNEELSRLRQQLAQPTTRLLTLMGPGGVGKTRLALHLARQLVDDHFGPFMNGIFFISMPPGSEPVSAITLANMIAAGLDHQLEGADTPLTQLSQWLADRELLLLIDNGEMLSEPGIEVIEQLLQASPRLKIMVTSQTRLNLAAEWVMGIDGLAYPPRSVHPLPSDPQNQALLTQLAATPAARLGRPESQPPDVEAYAAVQLFVARARQLDHRFALADTTTKTAVVRICQMVQGLPLAIELAAIWIRAFTPAQIADQIQTQLDTLATTMSHYPARHRSMQAVFNYAWQLLTEPEQTGQSRLSVFNGRFDLNAAQQVTAIKPVTLAALIDRSLVHKQTEWPPYHLHPLLRYFSQQHQSDSHRLQAKHATYYGRFMQQSREALQGAQQGEALRQIQQQIDDIRQGWHWAIAQPDTDLLDQYLPGLYQFYALRGWRHEGRELFTQATALKTVLSLPDHALLLTKILTRTAEFNDVLGDLDQAEALLHESRVIGHQVEDPDELSLVYKKLGMIAYRRGHYMDAQRHLEFCLQILREAGPQHRHSLAHALLSQAAIFRATGELDQARHLLEESLALYRQLEYPWGMAHALRLLGTVVKQMGDTALARQYFTKCLDYSRQIDDLIGTALAENELGRLAHDDKAYETAESHYRQALSLLEQLNDKRGIIRVLINLAALLVRRRQYAAATDSYERCLATAVQMQDLPFLLTLLTDMSRHILDATPDLAPSAQPLLRVVYHHPISSDSLKKQVAALLPDLPAAAVDDQPPPPLPQIERQWHILLDGLRRLGNQ